ncbi:MAG: PDZ domain-containing protein [Deltaproteobacteria bacterium]|nr:PDZ domain-containing protein [Deltaproteobacteria bacterium]
MFRAYRPLVILVMLSLLSFAAVDIFYALVRVRIEGSAAALPAGKANAGPHALLRPPLTDYGAIGERNLFGFRQREALKGPIDVNVLESTKLNLALLGTVAGGDEDYAVIEEKDKKRQALFTVGDTVAGATIRRIMRGAVVLSVDGRDEVLRMVEPKETPKTAQAEAGMPTDEGKTITIAKATIDDAFANMNEMLSQVRVRPHFKDGNPDGFMLSSIRSDSIFYKLGLRSGDIVLGVNDEQLSSVDDMLSLYQNLKSGSQVALNVRRQGREERMRYVFE